MNKHGLSRDIPEPIKRAVRQRDGFGCIICGNALIDYEHFDPEFADAEAHHEDGIVLLCIMCHGLKTRGRLSKDTVQKSRLNPKSKSLGFSFGPFDVNNLFPEIAFGNIISRNTPVIIRLHGDDVLSVKEPESNGGPFRFSCNIRNKNGAPMLDVVDNEWRTTTANWDVSLVGPRITIRSGLRDIDLVLRTDPPNKIVFERFKIFHKGTSIECSENNVTKVYEPGGQSFVTTGMLIDGCKAGLVIENGSMMIGVGGGSVHIHEAVFNPTDPPTPPKPSDHHGNVVKFPGRS